MPEKDILNNELFGSFEPEDESLIGGGGYTVTSSYTFTVDSLDHKMDVDFGNLEGY